MRGIQGERVGTGKHCTLAIVALGALAVGSSVVGGCGATPSVYFMERVARDGELRENELIGTYSRTMHVTVRGYPPDEGVGELTLRADGTYVFRFRDHRGHVIEYGPRKWDAQLGSYPGIALECFPGMLTQRSVDSSSSWQDMYVGGMWKHPRIGFNPLGGIVLAFGDPDADVCFAREEEVKPTPERRTRSGRSGTSLPTESNADVTRGGGGEGV